MATIVTWSVNSMKCYPQENNLQDVVFQISWQCNSVNGTYICNTYGLCTVPAPTGTFTPYEDLTEDTVLGWCWSNGIDKSAVESTNETQIQKQINSPVVQPPLPWVP